MACTGPLNANKPAHMHSKGMFTHWRRKANMEYPESFHADFRCGLCHVAADFTAYFFYTDSYFNGQNPHLSCLIQCRF